MKTRWSSNSSVYWWTFSIFFYSIRTVGGTGGENHSRANVSERFFLRRIITEIKNVNLYNLPQISLKYSIKNQNRPTNTPSSRRSISYRSSEFRRPFNRLNRRHHRIITEEFLKKKQQNIIKCFHIHHKICSAEAVQRFYMYKFKITYL